MRKSRSGLLVSDEDVRTRALPVGGHGAHPLLSLQQQAGNQAAVGAIQPKLEVGPAVDPAEREADAVADQVMRRLAEGPSAAAPTEAAPEGRLRSGPVLQRWWNPFKKKPQVSEVLGGHKMTEEEQGGVVSAKQMMERVEALGQQKVDEMNARRQELHTALLLQDPKANVPFGTWAKKAKEKWHEAAPDADPPSDKELYDTWKKVATAFAKPGGLIDKAMVSKRGVAPGQHGELSAGSFASWDDPRIVMGTPEFQRTLDDTGVIADSFSRLFVNELAGQPKGAKVAFWSGGGASEAAKDNCDVALEKSALARAFDWNTISTWTGGTEAILWASLSNRYATEVARMWNKFEVHGFIGPGVRDMTVFDTIESKAVLKVLNEEHGSEALKRITWHGVKAVRVGRDWKPDYTVSDGPWKGCFVKGKKALVENAVMGLREK